MLNKLSLFKKMQLMNYLNNIKKTLTEQEINLAQSLINECVNFHNKVVEIQNLNLPVSDKISKIIDDISDFRYIYLLKSVDFKDKFFGVYNSKYYSLYPRKVAGAEINKVIYGILKNHIIASYTNKIGDYKFYKYRFLNNNGFINDNINTVIIEVISRVLFMSCKPTLGQIYIASIQAIIEFFHIQDIDWTRVIECINYCLILDYENIYLPRIKQLQEIKDEFYKKVHEKRNGEKHKNTRKDKVIITDEEIKEQLELHKKKKDVIVYFTEKYNISERTVKYRLKETGFTKTYKSKSIL